MGGENGEDEIHSNVFVAKRFKFPKKFFDECNGADHVSVPRKLRSAIKKRTRQSISPPFSVPKKLNHNAGGGVTLRKDGNKSKLNLMCSSSRELEGTITKDEEEVAETLYALAGMIPESGTLSESKLKSLSSPEAENSVIASGVVNQDEEIKATSPQSGAEGLKQFPDAAVSAEEVAKSKSFECDTSMNTEKVDISGQPVVSGGYQVIQQNMLEEKRSGSLLWPGLSAVGSSSSDLVGSSQQFPISKFPAWSGSTGSDAQAQNTESCLPTVKDSQVPVDLKKSWKRCTAHVYISRLTKVLKTTVREDTVSSLPSQSSCHNELKQGTHIIQNSLTGKLNDMHDSLTGKLNDMHGMISTGSIACSTTENNPTKLRNAILLHKRLLQDQQQASPTSVFNSLANQNADFLSLSAGSFVVKGTNGANIAGNNLEVPLNSQNHPALHSLLPQNGYSSTSYCCLPATSIAQQVLLPPYLGGSSTRPSLENAVALPRQPSQYSEPQKLHNVSAANFSAQYKYGVSASQIRDWQNAGLQTPTFRPSQAQFARSSSSMESLSYKYSPVLLNDHEHMSISTSRATSRNNRGQYYNLPSGLEINGHVLYSNNMPSLQLLCNDHR